MNDIFSEIIAKFVGSPKELKAEIIVLKGV
jgi:hypothetical protein